MSNKISELEKKVSNSIIDLSYITFGTNPFVHVSYKIVCGFVRSFPVQYHLADKFIGKFLCDFFPDGTYELNFNGFPYKKEKALKSKLEKN